MQRLMIDIPGRSYPLVVSTGGLGDLGAVLRQERRGGKVFVVTNPVVGGLYLQACVDSLEGAGFEPVTVMIPDGESAKTLDTWRALVTALLERGLDRSGVVLALGGGVTGDIAGFAAATVMRGVALVQVPTTLLAMVDSSVGGKTGVNTPRGKNLVGAFHQPDLVFAPLSVLRTLPVEEVRAGLAEVIKHALLGDPELWTLLRTRGASMVVGDDDIGLAECVLRSAAFKAKMVALDERENGVRALLNLGHTVGHAIESVAAGTLRHGDCVAMGMRAEIRHGILTGRTLPSVAPELESLLLDVGLPQVPPVELPRLAMVEAVAYDKKRRRATLTLPSVADIGDSKCIAVSLCEVAEMFKHLDSTVPPGELTCTVEVSEKP